MDLYVVLGVRQDASDSEIKRAYRRLARRFHPDINPGDRDAAAHFHQVLETVSTWCSACGRTPATPRSSARTAVWPGASTPTSTPGTAMPRPTSTRCSRQSLRGARRAAGRQRLRDQARVPPSGPALPPRHQPRGPRCRGPLPPGARDSLYVVLGVRQDASDSEIKRAYRRLARRFHPDINPGDRDAAAHFHQVLETVSTWCSACGRTPATPRSSARTAVWPGASTPTSTPGTAMPRPTSTRCSR